jgi:hypothetical protein
VDESRTFDVTQIGDILVMTPNAWQVTEVERRRTADLTRSTATVSFGIAVFRQAAHRRKGITVAAPADEPGERPADRRSGACAARCEVCRRIWTAR